MLGADVVDVAVAESDFVEDELSDDDDDVDVDGELLDSPPFLGVDE